MPSLRNFSFLLQFQKNRVGWLDFPTFFQQEEGGKSQKRNLIDNEFGNLQVVFKQQRKGSWWSAVLSSSRAENPQFGQKIF